jgi:dienelactone hydrolase
MKRFGIVLFVFALTTVGGLLGRPVHGPATSSRPSTHEADADANKNGVREGTAGYEQRRKIQSTLFVPDPLPALESETYSQFEAAPGVVAERVSYATGYGLRVPAIVYRPKNVPTGKMPAIVVVNGHGGDKYTWYAYYTGIQYAQAGAAVLTYDPLGEGERNAERTDGARQHDRQVDPPEMARRLAGLMITDTMQAVSYLASRPDVDARRIAAVGYSMGSFVLSLACAIDMRLNSCVLAAGGNLDGPGGYWDSSTKKMCQAIPYQSLKFLGDRGAVIYSLHAERGATLIINGTADDVVAMPPRRRPSSLLPHAPGRAVAGETFAVP